MGLKIAYGVGIAFLLIIATMVLMLNININRPINVYMTAEPTHTPAPPTATPIPTRTPKPPTLASNIPSIRLAWIPDNSANCDPTGDNAATATWLSGITTGGGSQCDVDQFIVTGDTSALGSMAIPYPPCASGNTYAQRSSADGRYLLLIPGYPEPRAAGAETTYKYNYPPPISITGTGALDAAGTWIRQSTPYDYGDDPTSSTPNTKIKYQAYVTAAKRPCLRWGGAHRQLDIIPHPLPTATP